MTQFSTEQRVIITGSLLALAMYASAVALAWARPVMLPLTLGVLVAYLVNPLVDGVQVRLSAPRWAAILSAFVVISGATTALVLLLFASADGLSANSVHYTHRLTELGDSVLSLLDRIPAEFLPEALRGDQLRAADILAAMDLQALLGWAQNTAGGLMQLLSTLIVNGLLVTIFAVYLLAGRKPLEHRPGIWGEIDGHIQTYLTTKVAVSAATGTAVWLILTLLGLDLAFVFGLLAFLLNFIPSVGSMVATVLPLPIALMQFHSPGMVVLAVALPGTVQLFMGNVLEPRLMGENLDLHPITVLGTLIFWGLLWGPVGMLLSTPIAAVLKIVASRFETTQVLAEIMAGRLPGLEEEQAA